MDEFWVFGYGSLMWRPGFDYVDASHARLYGYHRALCVRSHVHRGTPERPGLVLGLDKGGSCLGIAFRVKMDHADKVVDYLRARELVTHVYKERHVQLQLRSGRRVPALAFVVDRGHAQYAGALSTEEAVRQVCGAVGVSGPNEEYVINTVNHLNQMNIRDHWLERVASAVERPGASASE
ncbi:gamma-glutamylcyclotransferase [Pararhizobium haloflavum]|uniref:gamma-glutamylcyclotransferase n=1 Tax=Pararhizobium haloflavum TaxID=2037914 RepID=UPI000C195A41|nr:gamma-glutamylcyclotransferase [Pararhizobium haloflavum]